MTGMRPDLSRVLSNTPRAKQRAPPERAPRQEGDLSVVTQPKTRSKLGRPPLYRVLLHNDDFTPMEFVVAILQMVFQRTESDAMAIMLHAHTTGYAVAGVYAFEIAEAKVEKVTELAREADLPLLCTLEPESGADSDPDANGGGERD